MPVKPSDAENRNDNERKQHRKKRLLICLLIMTLLAAAACTEKKPEPKETAANTSTETVQTTETAAETKEKGLTDDEKRDFVCKVFNEEETDPFSVFSMLGGNYSLGNIVSKNVAFDQQAFVNVYRDGEFYAEKADGSKRLSIAQDGIFYLVECGGKEPLLNSFASQPVGLELTLLGSTGFSLASLFAPGDDTKLPELRADQVTFTDVGAVFTDDFLRAVTRAFDAEKAEVTVDFDTMTVTVTADKLTSEKETFRVSQSATYGADGRCTAQSVMSEYLTDKNTGDSITRR